MTKDKSNKGILSEKKEEESLSDVPEIEPPPKEEPEVQIITENQLINMKLDTIIKNMENLLDVNEMLLMRVKRK